MIEPLGYVKRVSGVSLESDLTWDVIRSGWIHVAGYYADRVPVARPMTDLENFVGMLTRAKVGYSLPTRRDGQTEVVIHASIRQSSVHFFNADGAMVLSGIKTAVQ